MDGVFDKSTLDYKIGRKEKGTETLLSYSQGFPEFQVLPR